MPTNIVAVYGTLRKGLDHHTLLSDCKPIGLGWLTGFRMHDLGEFPAITFTQENVDRIRVEWYDVPDEVLSAIDQLEVYDPDALERSLHVRTPIFSPYGRGWIYTYNQTLKNAPHITAGDWARFTRKSIQN
ncbi:gamma-glutamylcyclotransferase [Marinomonas sp. A79]|uniref:Gamma-glutamylcyclotransferase n=1 Tax=Marinomonas vulgaris TaxID=2823372 RepID=A0ABS5HA03_9GAMM|nr:gamma-glutamylcyclotransferase family protein [Marinomonas vulgaris]MBR7888213.1 gamma-glutamylcyclotransferase [Marinomonas vulgaris]